MQKGLVVGGERDEGNVAALQSELHQSGQVPERQHSGLRVFSPCDSDMGICEPSGLPGADSAFKGENISGSVAGERLSPAGCNQKGCILSDSGLKHRDCAVLPDCRRTDRATGLGIVTDDVTCLPADLAFGIDSCPYGSIETCREGHCSIFTVRQGVCAAGKLFLGTGCSQKQK